MSYLKFEKNELVNLEYSLSRELIRSNRAGSYAATTIIGCNTRKYHGLLVCPLDEMDGEHHVLLSTLDATVVQHNKEFNLGIHKYEGDHYVPKGHKYVREFDTVKASYLVYRVGGVILSKEVMLVSKEEQVLVKYTLLDAHSDTLLRLQPFLAFRNYHALSKSNLYANTRYTELDNGIMSKLYEGYPGLYMQCSKPVEFVSVPDWYFNVEYLEEQKRGYEYKEDLYVPGYFEMPIKKGESIVFSASTSKVASGGLKKKFTSELNQRISKDSLEECLLNAAQQFIVRKKASTEIKAGFPWFGTWGRDTFMALPGLTLTTGDLSTALEVIDSMVARMKHGLFPNTAIKGKPAFNSSDAPLWFIRALQLYAKYDPEFDIWKKYGLAIKEVLETYRHGTSGIIHMLDNGLIHGEDGENPLTWMDAIVDGRLVTPRPGLVVEVNALWYNAVCQALQWSEKKDKTFFKSWSHLPELIRESFVDQFWNQERGYLADYVFGECRNFSVRPSQVIAVSVEHSPLTSEMKKSILDVVQGELLTPRGLRSLSPKNEAYKGIYEGNQEKRDRAYHQGTVWPWFLEHYALGVLEVHKKTGLSQLKKIFDGFEEEMSKRGIGSISEIYDGNPPHYAKGAISQATGVAALLRISEMIEGCEY
ncbi:MAG: glycogen debranching enzyme family protein [Bacteroidales bacterium]|nr:glycogen debranching enzyme family protein [Bacteroidales bacterium]